MFHVPGFVRRPFFPALIFFVILFIHVSALALALISFSIVLYVYPC